ncbi:D-amino-acid transaminase [Pseudochrobactrum asaccharolyticum]|uniref:Probable branched-chain-amino-acid aminotransferase n=1 Tax=Pseudochrobactrum asaccharolyticum TaxID=354351 RepID=A0A366DQY2_9HYPH|nr:D-amino-acid transaminase [Pseudochrobactrum asaccharolyticum]RBO91889.1 D-alanine aminotransferase [Pseudochrobactrum asaccharolyticum]
MSRIVYVNGAYVPEEEAKISVFDRGFVFGDGIYEVSAVIDGKLVDNDAHMARLGRSLKMIDVPAPMSDEDIIAMQNELIKRNNLTEGVVYMQITRGAADRDFVYSKDMTPSLVAYTQVKNLTASAAQKNGIAIHVVEDIRWQRRDIKTVMLLAQVLAKQEATAHGCQDAWMQEDGYITEGASSSAFIITEDGTLIVRPNSNAILPGCTRIAMLKIAEEQNLKVEDRRFTLEEAFKAKEAFQTSASGFVTPVVKIAGTVIADGKPGPITRSLQEKYIEVAKAV